MVATESTMLELGTAAAPFALPTPAGHIITLDDLYARHPHGLVVAFICNHCPFVIHLREAMADFARWCGSEQVGFVGINSNDAEAYPDDSPARMLEEIKIAGYEFPYLIDADQSVARSYRAACTPDFYLFDGDRRLFYRGRFDGSRPNNDIPVTGDDLYLAVETMLDGTPPPRTQVPSMGCNIKWKPGAAPEYFPPSP